MGTSTSAAPTMAASGKVLDTFELIENIVLYLPLRQLLLSQRVTKAFFDVVNNSHDIGRALFMKPTAASKRDKHFYKSGILNPFLTPDHLIRSLTSTEILRLDFGEVWTSKRATGPPILLHYVPFRFSPLDARRSNNSRDKMLVISAPAMPFHVVKRVDRQTFENITSEPISTFGELVDWISLRTAAIRRGRRRELKSPSRDRRKESNLYWVDDCQLEVDRTQWLRILADIDSTTGREMLTIFNNNTGDSSQSLRRKSALCCQVEVRSVTETAR